MFEAYFDADKVGFPLKFIRNFLPVCIIVDILTFGMQISLGTQILGSMGIFLSVVITQLFIYFCGRALVSSLIQSRIRKIAGDISYLQGVFTFKKLKFVYRNPKGKRYTAKLTYNISSRKEYIEVISHW